MRKLTKLIGVALIATGMMASFTGCTGLYNQIDELEKELAEEKAKNEKLEKKLASITATQEDLNKLQAELDKLIASGKADAATIESLNDTIDKLNAKINKLNADLLEANTTGMTDGEKADYEATIAGLNSTIAQLEQQIKDLIEANTATIWKVCLNNTVDFDLLKNAFDRNNGKLYKEDNKVYLSTSKKPEESWFIGKADITICIITSDKYSISISTCSDDE